jgi:hypothetical protein
MRERAMSEFEFDRLLDAVQAAIVHAPQEEFLTHQMTSRQPARAANDNETVWDFIPFPEGWYAAC